MLLNFSLELKYSTVVFEMHYTFFCKNTRLIFAQNERTIPASVEEENKSQIFN